MSQNVYSKVQTHTANLKLAKSEFKTAFVKIRKNEKKITDFNDLRNRKKSWIFTNFKKVGHESSISEHVCMYRPWACLRNYSFNLRQSFVHVYSSGAVLLWQRCDTLCTSGLMDDVIFAHNGHEGEEDHARPGWTTSRRAQDSPCKSQSEWQRTGIDR